MTFLKKYREALIALVIYAGCIASLFAYTAWSASSNPADSGESAIILVIPASPWIWLLPRELLGPISGVMCIVFNGLLFSALVHLVAKLKSRNRS